MLKIVVERSAGMMARVRLEGQVIGPWVEELERACRPMLADGAGLALDLGSVSFVSREGARLLSSLRGRGVALLGCSGLVGEQLRAHEEATR